MEKKEKKATTRARSKADIVAQEEKALALEEKRLRVELMRRDVERMQQQERDRLKDSETQQRSIDDYNKNIIAQQKVCRHRKGGRDMAGILNGQDSNYSIAKHTYNSGDTGVMCSRCGVDFLPPGTRIQKACQPDKYKKAMKDPAEFKRQLAEYTEAMSWPTDNAPSGNQTHMIQQTQASVA